ncbi:hypothetical protein A2U01_0106258, partial [Trifolium medium]|nr:hypothetical protein [Trifolium medium]
MKVNCHDLVVSLKSKPLE